MKENLKKVATAQEEKELVENINEKLVSNKFGKTEVRHAAEAILNNKKPQVNKTTRAAYESFCTNLKAIAKDSGNSALLQKVKKFEEKWQLN